MCKNMSRTRCHVIKIVNYCISKKMFWNSLFHCNLRGGARAAPTARFVGQLDGDHKRSEISVWEICSATRHVQGRIGLSGVREISRKAEALILINVSQKFGRGRYSVSRAGLPFLICPWTLYVNTKLSRCSSFY